MKKEDAVIKEAVKDKKKPVCKYWQTYDAKSKQCLIPGACPVSYYYSTRKKKCRKLSKNRCPKYGRVYLKNKKYCTEQCLLPNLAVIDRFGKCKETKFKKPQPKCMPWKKFNAKTGECEIPKSCPKFSYYSPRLKRCRRLSRNRCRRYGRVYNSEKKQCKHVCKNTAWAIQNREGICKKIEKLIDDTEALLKGTNSWNN